ncbi:MAG: UpxY family transcription antiterminator [Chitinophagaceae bacterium]
MLTLSANNPLPGINWHIVRTKMHCEQKVVSLLTRKRVKNYCPLHEVKSDWHEWKKPMLKPLFPSFVFVYIKEELREEIKNTLGILNFEYWLNEPVIISPGEINTIRVILKEFHHVSVEKSAVKKDYIGSMAETLLLIEKKSLDNKAVKIILPSVGYYLVAESRKGTIGLHR